jgi:hypothetical protein
LQAFIIIKRVIKGSDFHCRASNEILTGEDPSLEVKLQEKVAKPTRFRYHISNTLVLGFCTRARECGLSLGRPGNEVVTKKHTIAGGRAAGVRTSTPIGISIRNKFLNRGWIKMQTIV